MAVSEQEIQNIVRGVLRNMSGAAETVNPRSSLFFWSLHSLQIYLPLTQHTVDNLRDHRDHQEQHQAHSRRSSQRPF